MPERADDDATGANSDGRARVWQKGSRCQETCCVEVTSLSPDSFGVRDSALGNDGPILVLSREAFQALPELSKQADPRM